RNGCRFRASRPWSPPADRSGARRRAGPRRSPADRERPEPNAAQTPRARRRSLDPAGRCPSASPPRFYCLACPLPPDVRIDLARRRQVGLGAGLVALLFFGETPIVVSASMVRIELDRLVIVLD